MYRDIYIYRERQTDTDNKERNWTSPRGDRVEKFSTHRERINLKQEKKQTQQAEEGKLNRGKQRN